MIANTIIVLDVIPLSEEFTNIVDTIGSRAANLPGGVRNLGKDFLFLRLYYSYNTLFDDNLGNCLKQMATASRKLNTSYTDWVSGKSLIQVNHLFLQ